MKHALNLLANLSPLNKNLSFIPLLISYVYASRYQEHSDAENVRDDICLPFFSHPSQTQRLAAVMSRVSPQIEQ